MTKEREALARVVGLMDDVAVQVRALEAEAEILLHEQGDPDGAAANLRRKAELLAGLPDVVEPYLDGLAPAARERVENGAGNFAGRALPALAQGSVFWMRNLLYPEDYADGDPNDLERFIAALAGRGEE